ncbi:hypothetical protein X737_16340 [Mesorhizobium sp. L48C026A00]|jgi:hypothetical protein|nr:hypothetical protein X737_16340 [Mesorhizobium sp. L48C026A00]
MIGEAVECGPGLSVNAVTGSVAERQQKRLRHDGYRMKVPLPATKRSGSSPTDPPSA